MMTTSDTRPLQIEVDFDLAEHFLKTARAAHAQGNESEFVAARKLVALALGIEDAPRRR